MVLDSYSHNYAKRHYITLAERVPAKSMTQYFSPSFLHGRNDRTYKSQFNISYIHLLGASNKVTRFIFKII